MKLCPSSPTGWDPHSGGSESVAMEDAMDGGREIKVYHYIPRLIASALSGALTGFFALGNLVFSLYVKAVRELH